MNVNLLVTSLSTYFFLSICPTFPCKLLSYEILSKPIPVFPIPFRNSSFVDLLFTELAYKTTSCLLQVCSFNCYKNFQYLFSYVKVDRRH